MYQTLSKVHVCAPLVKTMNSAGQFSTKTAAVKTYKEHYNVPFRGTCLLESSKALTKAADALDADRIVSVRPRRYILKEALSYVGQQRWYILPRGCGRKTVTHLQLLTHFVAFYCSMKERNYTELREKA